MSRDNGSAEREHFKQENINLPKIEEQPFGETHKKYVGDRVTS